MFIRRVFGQSEIRKHRIEPQEVHDCGKGFFGAGCEIFKQETMQGVTAKVFQVLPDLINICAGIQEVVVLYQSLFKAASDSPACSVVIVIGIGAVHWMPQDIEEFDSRHGLSYPTSNISAF